MTERPPFPDTIDASLLSAFRSCPRKCQLEYIEHWKSKTPNVHLHAGGAFARGLEIVRESYYVDGETSEVAIARGIGALLKFYGLFECPEDSAKSAERMAGALEFYFDVWPMETDSAVPTTLPSGKRGIEFSFLEPLDIHHPVTGDPLLYSGRFDMLCDYAGQVFGEDDKTTSQLGASWGNHWPLRSQFTGYAWGSARAGMPIAGMLVRGVSILKEKYGSAQSVNYYPKWMVDRWYAQTLLDIERMIDMWRDGYWDYNLDHSCAEFGGCVFRTVCQSERPEQWLEVGFEKRRWDPVTRLETKV